jgi:hypothetical protein
VHDFLSGVSFRKYHLEIRRYLPDANPTVLGLLAAGKKITS